MRITHLPTYTLNFILVVGRKQMNIISKKKATITVAVCAHSKLLKCQDRIE